MIRTRCKMSSFAIEVEKEKKQDNVERELENLV